MPKKTFLNLSEDKKRRITNVILEEFANFGYHGASVNRIVDKCKIAKGSFYQYFEDMDDLLIYALDILGKEKISYIIKELKSCEDTNFIQKFKAIVIAGIKFSDKNPLAFKIANNLYQVANTPLISKLIKANISKDTFMYDIFKEGMERGYIRDDIGVNTAIKIYTDTAMALLIENSSKDKTRHDYETVFTTVLDILQNGIINKKEK